MRYEVARFAGVIAAQEDDEQLERLLAYSELAHGLLSAFGRFGPTGILDEPPVDAMQWSRLCREARKQIEERVGEAAGTVGTNVPTHWERVAAVMTAAGDAFQGLVRPTPTYTELWCSGSVRRIEVSKIAPHGPRCACVEFATALRRLRLVADGESPWELADDGLVWIGTQGILGPMVVRVEGRELATRLGDRTDSEELPPFEWGYRGERPSHLARAILADALHLQEAEVPTDQVNEFAFRFLLDIERDAGFVINEARVANFAGDSASRRAAS